MAFLVRSILFALCAVPAFAASSVTIDPPVASTIVPHSFNVGKTLVFPITAADGQGLPLNFTVTSSNPKIMVRARTGNPVLRLTVDYGAAQPGDMVLQLFRDRTPVTAGFIGGFAQAGFYDSLTFHRILKGFVIQGGDPLGTGGGGPGMTGGNASTAFSFETERRPELIFSGRGQLAMANSGINPTNYSASNGSQFFITLDQLRAPTSDHQANLDFQYTIFGQMLYGWDVLDAIGNVAVDGNGKPLAPVTIQTATVEPDNHDAVLLISATAVGSATITITAKDSSGGSATQTFTVSAGSDTINDPPFFAPIPPLIAPVHTELDFGLHAFDLESDYLFFNDDGFILGGSNALSQVSGSTFAVLGNAGFSGPVTVGVRVAQFDVATGRSESAVDMEPIMVGIGDRAAGAEPVVVKGAPGQSFSNAVIGRLNDTDPAGTPGNFSATVNWGDGTPVESGTVAKDPTVAGPGHYMVTGSHQYAKAGAYTIVILASGNNGADITVRSPAIISAGPVVAEGVDIAVSAPTIAGRIVATFQDSRAGAVSDYSALVDWGDGTTSAGTIVKVPAGGFAVRGKHTYRDPEVFPISVHVHRSGDASTSDAYAWATAEISGFKAPQHLPPFPVVHIVGAWNSGPSKSISNPLTSAFALSDELAQLSGTFVVVNSGALKAPPSKLRFWLSDDQTLNTSGANADTLLKEGTASMVAIGALGAGQGVSGHLIVSLPKGQSGAGKYLLSELVYTDPIIDASAVPKVVVSGPISPSVIAYGSSGSVTTRTGGAVTFRVILDTAPTNDVTVPIASSDTNEGTVSAASLTFTSANWNVAQTVTVTGHADGKAGSQAYSVGVGPCTSSDTRYSGVSGNTISLTNADAAH